MHDIPKEFKSLSVELSGKSHGNIKSFASYGNELNEEQKQFLKELDVNTKLYIDIIIDGKKANYHSASVYVVR